MMTATTEGETDKQRHWDKQMQRNKQTQRATADLDIAQMANEKSQRISALCRPKTTSPIADDREKGKEEDKRCEEREKREPKEKREMNE